MEIINKFRKHMPDFNFTTDVIVGFPGESDEDFKQTVEVAKAALFSHIHTFRYSRRKGTRADRMEDQNEEWIKKERSEVIRLISEENRMKYMQSMLGKEQRVLIESVNKNGLARGYGEHYLPVGFNTSDHFKNSFQPVRLSGLESSEPPTMTGSMIEGKINE